MVQIAILIVKCWMEFQNWIQYNKSAFKKINVDYYFDQLVKKRKKQRNKNNFIDFHNLFYLTLRYISSPSLFNNINFSFTK